MENSTNYSRIESEEIWQIIEHLAGLGYQITGTNQEKGYPDGDAKRPTINKEEPIRYPTQFEEDVRIVYDELMSVLIKKHKDYGAKNIADAPGGALNGLRVRIHDKTARINNLIDFRRKAEYESLEDSFKDLANYAIIALLVLRDKWDK
jgi:hypothetical protein